MYSGVLRGTTRLFKLFTLLMHSALICTTRLSWQHAPTSRDMWVKVCTHSVSLETEIGRKEKNSEYRQWSVLSVSINSRMLRCDKHHRHCYVHERMQRAELIRLSCRRLQRQRENSDWPNSVACRNAEQHCVQVERNKIIAEDLRPRFWQATVGWTWLQMNKTQLSVATARVLGRWNPLETKKEFFESTPQYTSVNLPGCAHVELAM